MLLRTTLSNTKKFFQKTVENLKSFLSGGYQRLPKSSPCNSFPCGGGGGSIHDHQAKYSQSYKELDKFSRDFVTDHHEQANEGRRISKKKEPSIATTVLPSRKDEIGREAATKLENQKKKKIVYQGKRYYQNVSRTTKVLERERSFLVAKKLKELEMMDNGNAEHVLDIEEVLHYYSRLTCPAYVDIVDQFFMDMYSELLNGQTSITARFNNSSRQNLQRVRFHHH